METAAPPPFSLTRGGPFYALLRRTRVTREDRNDLHREMLLLVAVTWVPLALIGVMQWTASGILEPILRDVAVHVRLLVAVPLLTLARAALESTTADVVTRLGAEELVDARGLSGIARGVVRWARSTPLELLLLAFSFALGLAMHFGLLSATGAVTGEELRADRGPALVWYQCASYPIFAFLFFRFIARWMLWGRLLWRISRQPLLTEPTHPDLAGGIGFIGRPIIALAIAIFAGSAVFAAGWANRALHERIPLAQLSQYASVLAVVGLLFAIAPLVPFVPSLFATRVRGIREYGSFAHGYSRSFRQRWIESRSPQDPLGTPDIQSLADLGTSFEVIDKMHFIPFGRREIVLILASVILPIIPLLLTQIPLSTLLLRVVKSVAGVG